MQCYIEGNRCVCPVQYRRALQHLAQVVINTEGGPDSPGSIAGECDRVHSLAHLRSRIDLDNAELVRVHCDSMEPPPFAKAIAAVQGYVMSGDGTLGQIRATGALLGFLADTRRHLVGADGRIRLNSVEQFHLSDFLHIDVDTLSALQVFRLDQHPSMIRPLGKIKEGASRWNG